jgi:hypothetical protein
VPHPSKLAQDEDHAGDQGSMLVEKVDDVGGDFVRLSLDQNANARHELFALLGPVFSLRALRIFLIPSPQLS